MVDNLVCHCLFVSEIYLCVYCIIFKSKYTRAYEQQYKVFCVYKLNLLLSKSI